MALLNQDRTKLDGIVAKMQSNGESDTYIQSVVNDFRTKYDPKGLQADIKSKYEAAASSKDNQGPQNDYSLGGVGEALKGAVSGAVNTVLHPIDTAKAAIKSQVDQYDRAKSAAKEGDYGSAAMHGVAAAVPVFGPAAVQVGEDIGSGNVSRGVTNAAILLGSDAAMKGAGKLAGKVLPKGIQTIDKSTVGEKIGAESKALDAKGAQPDAQTILGELNKLIADNKTSAGVVINDTRNAALQAVHNKVLEIATNPKTTEAVQDLQGVKRDLQSTAKAGKAYNADVDASLKGQAAGDSAKAVREGLRNTPGGDTLNALDDQFAKQMRQIDKAGTVGKWLGKVVDIPTLHTMSAAKLGQEAGESFARALQSPTVQNAPKVIQNEIYKAVQANDFKTASKITTTLLRLRKTDEN